MTMEFVRATCGSRVIRSASAAIGITGLAPPGGLVEIKVIARREREAGRPRRRLKSSAMPRRRLDRVTAGRAALRADVLVLVAVR
jgi:hypothetical protein